MITPETKSWTWVLETACPDCGLDTPAVPTARVAALTRANAAAWHELLVGGGDELRTRPNPDTWSPVEYACHVRDVFRLFDERLRLMLEQDAPDFANWDQDATAVESRYAEQDPATVAAELAEASAVLADRFAAVADDQWTRTGNRSDGTVFTVESFARYFIHDPVHHLWDVTGVRAG
ncbi:DinB family protein [Embleya sp. NBC_00896]|uniref:DinB family protein n=1 Tax=Embleya sp. NBC_00896 TaxID=2975961 RepID=UPI003867FCEA|nr:DinB family protein [Embleya sp. NBC_00896]